MDELSRRNLVTVAVITMASTVAFAGASLMSNARAADFPTRAITLVVPYPAGGGVDAMARVVAQKLSDAFRQTVTVDNRGGGGGTIGTRAVARAAPDGYTLLLGPLGCLFSDRRAPRMRNELSAMQVASGQHERSDMRG